MKRASVVVDHALLAVCRVVNLAADQLWLGSFYSATTHDINRSKYHACNFYSALQSTCYVMDDPRVGLQH